jgi:rhamnosyltransferase
MLKIDFTKEIGLHEEKLFIDYVDFEYSLRARKMGYTIVETQKARLKHLIGESKKVSLKFFPFYKTYTTNHSPLRRYYRWRNAFYLWSTYQDSFPKWIKKNKKQTFSDLKKIILFEDNKIAKIKAIIDGIRDAKKGNFGKKVLTI